MIGHVQARGNDVAGLLAYLYGPGRRAEHSNPRLVAGWIPADGLEPAIRRDGTRDFAGLAALLELPLALHRGPPPRDFVFHLTLRAAPEDPELADRVWKTIAEEVMHRAGLSPRDGEDDGVRWVAVHHGDQHVHIVAVLARQDGRPVRLHNNYYRIAETLTWAEQKFGLRVAAQADRTAPRRPTRAERAKAVMAGRAEPARVVLRRTVEAAAAASRNQREFFAELRARGVGIRLKADPCSASATGYAVNLAGDVNAKGEPVWFGGGKLAADLTLPKLRRRWAGAELDSLPELDKVHADWRLGNVGFGKDVDAEQVCAYVAGVVERAASQLRSGTGDQADLASAAASVFTTTADVMGGLEMRHAADEFARAARTQWGRVPETTPGGRMLRTAAYLLAACRRIGSAIRKVGGRLLEALRSLADALAGVRSGQGLVLQTDAASKASSEVPAFASFGPDTPAGADTAPMAEAPSWPGLLATHGQGTGNWYARQPAVEGTAPSKPARRSTRRTGKPASSTRSSAR